MPHNLPGRKSSARLRLRTTWLAKRSRARPGACVKASFWRAVRCDADELREGATYSAAW